MVCTCVAGIVFRATRERRAGTHYSSRASSRGLTRQVRDPGAGSWAAGTVPAASNISPRLGGFRGTPEDWREIRRRRQLLILEPDTPEVAQHHQVRKRPIPGFDSRRLQVLFIPLQSLRFDEPVASSTLPPHGRWDSSFPPAGSRVEGGSTPESGTDRALPLRTRNARGSQPDPQGVRGPACAASSDRSLREGRMGI